MLPITNRDPVATPVDEQIPIRHLARKDRCRIFFGRNEQHNNEHGISATELVCINRISLEVRTINMSGLIAESAIRAAAHVGSSKIPSKIAKSSAALFSAYGGSKPTLPDLPYDYGALARTLLYCCDSKSVSPLLRK